MRVEFGDATRLLRGINDAPSASYSISWSDVDADGRPDLYVGNHGDRPPLLFLSEGHGRYQTVAAPDTGKDAHTAVWADFDRDGSPELVQRVGGGAGRGLSHTKRSSDLFDFADGRLVLADRGLGLDYPLARGRGATPFDFDGDGRLDVFYGAGVRPDGRAPATVLLQQPAGRYAAAPEFFGTSLAGVESLLPGRFDADASIDFALLDRNGVLEVLRSPPGGYQRELLFDSDETLRSLTVDDFNNDGLSDIWIARAREFDQLARADARTLRFSITAQEDDRSMDRISFAGAGPMTLSIPTGRFGPKTVVYGSASTDVDPGSVHLDSRSRSVWGRPDALDERDGLLGIWYTPETGRWHIEASDGTDVSLAWVQATARLRLPSYTGLDTVPQPRDVLLLARGDGSFRATRPVEAAPATSIASGDFDNDGDIDAYAVISGPVGNVVDRLYVNDGQGHFTERTVLGRGSQEGGVGDVATSVDFDRDGWLDVFVANGGAPRGSVPDARYVLLRNGGGVNGWLEVTLRAANGDPVVIGSIVEARAGSGTQTRIWDAGVRPKVQDDPVLHFGLGDEAAVDLAIRWSDGLRTLVSDVAARTHLTVWRGSDDGETISGSSGSDALTGSGGDDRLRGHASADFLFGGVGNDVLVGGRGRDTLTGGVGADVFVIGEHAGADRILDFRAGIDTLILRARSGIPDLDHVEIDFGPLGTQVRFADSTVLMPQAAVPLGASDFFLT
jgi:Ca2+-binding RTX toxin-like protein